MLKIIFKAVIFLYHISGAYFLGTISALAYNVHLKKEYSTEDKEGGLPWKECFHYKKHFSFLMGWTLSKVPRFIVEQYVIRLYTEKCQPCYESGECHQESCGCNPYQKACSLWESCMGGYGPVETDEQKYADHRKAFPVNIKIEYTNNI